MCITVHLPTRSKKYICMSHLGPKIGAPQSMVTMFSAPMMIRKHDYIADDKHGLELPLQCLPEFTMVISLRSSMLPINLYRGRVQTYRPAQGVCIGVRIPSEIPRRTAANPIHFAGLRCACGGKHQGGRKFSTTGAGGDGVLIERLSHFVFD